MKINSNGYTNNSQRNPNANELCNKTWVLHSIYYHAIDLGSRSPILRVLRAFHPLTPRLYCKSVSQLHIYYNNIIQLFYPLHDETASGKGREGKNRDRLGRLLCRWSRLADLGSGNEGICIMCGVSSFSFSSLLTRRQNRWSQRLFR